MKTITVFYSLTGKSEIVAANISKQLNCSILEIVEEKKRSKFSAFFPGVMESGKMKSSKIRNMDYDKASVDNIILVGPVWAGRQAPALNAFIRAHVVQGKNIYCVMTSSGGGSEHLQSSLKQVIESEGCRFKGMMELRTSGTEGKEFMRKLSAGEENVDLKSLEIKA